MTTEPKGLLFDMVRCPGYRKCVDACMERHDVEGDSKEVVELSAAACTSMVDKEDWSIRNLCRHCLDPSCVSAVRRARGPG